MSVGHLAKIVVGIPCADLNLSQDEIDTLCESNDLLLIQPYFDTEFDDCLVALIVKCTKHETFVPIDMEHFVNEIRGMEIRVFNALGMHPKVFLTTHGY